MNEQTIHPGRSVSLLAEFLEEMEAINDPMTLFERTCRFLPHLTQTDFASLLMFELPSCHLAHKNVFCLENAPVHSPRLMLYKEIDEVVLQRGMLLTCDPQQTNGYLVLMDEIDGPWQQSELHLPLFWNKTHFVLLSLGKKKCGADFTVEELDGLRILSCLLSRWSGTLNSAEKGKNPLPANVRWMPVRRVDAYADIIGVSPAVREIKKIIGQIATTEASVLITGESGTGKELVARAIHRSSLRHEKSMVIMNCASIPESLVESELFGHEKGAFTGAICRRKGKFEFAHESTLFLDEIGDTSLSTQAKLLRVLQDGVFDRVGGESPLYANVRLISATNKNVLEMIRQGGFREDLFFRINLVQIEVPPLRERPMDIPVLIEFFLRQFNEKYHVGLSRINEELYDLLLHYDFPGNVRELRNLVERAVIFHNNPSAIRRMIPSTTPKPNHPAMRLDDLEKQHILSVLNLADNNKTKAARLLGIARKTLREKMSRYSLQ
jgi:transcriptional regulator with GAF, ATPase, and Fis domain